MKLHTHTRGLSTCGLVLVTLAALSSSALAQSQAGPPADSQPVADLDLEQLLNVEVQSVFGASKFLQKITEAPASVTVITREEIRRFGYRNLADALRNVRGFYTTYDRIYEFAGIRGFQRPGDYNTRFLLLIDGFRANDNVYEQASIGDDFQLDLDLVERIEVVRGPSSSLYGSNAFFGVVNVVTRGGRQLETAASVETGSLGYRGVRARAAHAFQNGAELVLAASSHELDGQRRLYFPELDAPETNGGVSRDLDWQNRKSVYASLGVGSVNVQAALTEREKGVPTGAYGTLFNDARASVVDRWGFVNVGYERRVGAATLRARGFFGRSHYVGNMPYPADGEPQTGAVLNRDIGDGTWWGGETMVSGSWRERHRVSAGVEFRHNLRQDQTNFDEEPRYLYLDDRRRSVTWAWFGQDEFKLGRGHILSVGVRGDHYSDFDAPVMPRLAWIFAPTDTTTVKALYGRAFRAPAAYEVYYAYGDYKANVDLAPERIRTGEVVVEQYIGRRYRASANVFHYRVTGLIAQEVDPEDASLQYRNIASAEATGVELEVEGKWPGGLSARVSVAAQNTTDGDTHERLINSPVHVGQVAVMFPLVSQRLLAGVDARAVGSRHTRMGGTAAGFVSPNMTLLVPGLFGRLDLSFSVYNLSGRAYADPAADETPQDVIAQDGRTARLRATWRF